MSITIQEQLEKYLFREGANTFAVLDGASVQDLPQRIFEFKPASACLYRGEISDEMVHVAPYLVLLEKGSDFTKWLLTDYWGKHWGIFAQSPQSLSRMVKHFRSLLTVNDDLGNPMLFRFYDPRVLPPFLLTCAIDELEFIFGSVKYYFAESFDKSQLVRMNVADGALVETSLFFGINKG